MKSELREYEPSPEGRKLLDDYWNVAFESGRQKAINDILKLVNSEIKQEIKAKEDKLVRDWDIVKELKSLNFLIHKIKDAKSTDYEGFAEKQK